MLEGEATVGSRRAAAVEIALRKLDCAADAPRSAHYRCHRAEYYFRKNILKSIYDHGFLSASSTRRSGALHASARCTPMAWGQCRCCRCARLRQHIYGFWSRRGEIGPLRYFGARLVMAGKSAIATPHCLFRVVWPLGQDSDTRWLLRPATASFASLCLAPICADAWIIRRICAMRCRHAISHGRCRSPRIFPTHSRRRGRQSDA